MVKILSAACLVLWASATLGAQGEWPNNPNADPCDAGSGLGQAECASRRMLKTEGEMNLVYKQLMDKLPKEQDEEPTSRSKLASSQAAWLLYRQESCSFVRAMLGEGTLSAALTIYCEQSATRKRIDELRSYLSCVEDYDCEQFL